MKMKGKSKQGYSVSRNVRWMIQNAWKNQKSVLWLCLIMATLGVGLNLVQLFIAPEILGKVERALEDAGFGERLKTMKNGLETILYKDFAENGVMVSGGEAQKIAIARALYKDAPFIILDEPTAALDPIAEAEIYSKFNEIAGDKTAVYISHRLSSCRFCDEIAVFHEGQVVQQETHEELLEEGGKYSELWNAQAQYYQTEGAI